jgi:hypothetical protein
MCMSLLLYQVLFISDNLLLKANVEVIFLDFLSILPQNLNDVSFAFM